MAYGMEVKDSAGAIIFDSSTVTWIQVGFFTVTSGDTTPRVFPGAEPNSVIISSSINNYSVKEYGRVTNETTVRWTTTISSSWT